MALIVGQLIRLQVDTHAVVRVMKSDGIEADLEQLELKIIGLIDELKDKYHPNVIIMYNTFLETLN